ncbi:MAG: DUF11 domain-containing protein, partial [Candidatus Marinimicrobia bacterium]|nr:DUF11 domain-containing protein [Candidatus Neomarinimicrobiota bacterium]
HIRGYSSRKGLTIFIILSALFTYPLIAQESWPLSTDWKPLISSDWEPFTDPQDVSQSYIDFIEDINGSCGYYWSTSTSLFFRIVLRNTAAKKLGATELNQCGWGIMLDVDKDNFLDWFILVGGITEELYTYPNALTFPDNTADGTEYWSIFDPFGGAGYIQIIAAPTPTYPDAHYLDVQVPYTTLQMTGYDRNMNYNTTFKVVFGSGTSESLNFLDYTGISATLSDAFAASTIFSPSQPDSYGDIYDTRDTDPHSNAGIWYRNETLTISGSGWPTSTSAYYNSGQHNVRIVDHSSSIVWNGSMTTTTTGNLSSYSLWTIGTSILPDIYTLEVEDPREPGTYNSYDTFEIQAPVISITKTVNYSTVDPGDTIQYTIKIVNDGNLNGNLTSVVDDLPSGYSYLNNSSSGLTTSNPSINGSQLTWSGTWSLSGPDSIDLVFSAISSTTPGTYTNSASVSGGNFDTKSTGATAEVMINGPGLSLVKSVDKVSAAPGDTITYTVSYSNPGNGNATYVFILESIPINTDYVTGSATGTNMTITYSHNNGSSYDGDDTTPVTDLSFQLSGTLTPGLSGQIQFKVKVK